MFPLAGDGFPRGADGLRTAIEDAIREVFSLPKKAGVTVDAGGERFPRVKRVRVDLDGARVSIDEPPPKPVGIGERKRGITVDRLEISGRPIHYEQTRLELDLHATGLSFDFDRDETGRGLLVLTDAEDGEVSAKIKKADIEALALAAATVAAKQQGVTVQELDLDLTSSGKRSVAADVRVKAKKMMVSGVLRVAGAAEVDDELNATLSGLTCTGEGVIGSAAAGFLQKHLARFDGRQIPLMAFSLGDVTLRDLSIDVDDVVEISAAFGRQAKKKTKAKTKRA